MACAVLGILVELGLDQVVAVSPWLIVAFAVGLLAAILGGVLGGVVAAALGLAAQVSLIPDWIPAVRRLEGVGWQIDLGVAVAALIAGLWIRSLILHPRAIPIAASRNAPTPAVSGEQATEAGRPGSTGPGPAGAQPVRSVAAVGPAGRPRAGAPPDAAHPTANGGAPRDRIRTIPAVADAEIVATAVRELGAARTPAQVADALARHAAALAGAAGAVVYLRRDGSDEATALGRSGPVDSSTPERLPARGGGSSDAGAAVDDGRSVDQPIGSGGALGILRLTAAADGPPPRPGPLVDVVVEVAAAALERGDLQAKRRAAEATAAGAVGRVAILARLAAALVGGTTVEEVARTLVDVAVDDLAAGFAVLHVPDEKSGAFTMVHSRGYPAGLAASDRSVPVGASAPVTRAAADRSVVELIGEDGWREAFPTASNVPAITGVRAITAIPMQASGDVQGVLTIGWRTAADRARADRDLLATAADQGAQALERAILHAHDEDARRFQEAFIGVLSHELRTPITTIVAGSRLLRRRLDGDPRAAELSDDVETEADRLSRIVDDLLVLSRLERRQVTIGDEPVHLDHLLARVIRSEAARWPAHRILVRPSRGSHVVLGEETYVEQVLRNLISNAAKYSPPGSLVEVAVEDAPAGDVHVGVLDQGPGVAPAEVEELFSLFYRSPTTAASAAGAGIGLFVSRRLVTEMGGRMWARPRAGGGSEFGFSLDRYPIDEAEIEVEPGGEPPVPVAVPSVPSPGHAPSDESPPGGPPEA